MESENGTVTLRGTVSSWADHDEAVSAAWAAPGVTRVAIEASGFISAVIEAFLGREGSRGRVSGYRASRMESSPG